MLEMYWRLPKASQPANERCFVECRHDGSRAASPTFTSLLQYAVVKPTSVEVLDQPIIT